jgi:hypothetical protein
MAGVTALLDSYTGSRQGLLNPNLYALAKAQFNSPSGGTSCFSNGQSFNTGITVGLPAPGCVFNDVTTGNNDVPCLYGDLNCYAPSYGFGMLSLTGQNSLAVAYPSTPGYDEATGIGTVNVYNLLTNWTTGATSSVTLTADSATISHTDLLFLTATVATPSTAEWRSVSGELRGFVTFSAGGVALGNCELTADSCTVSVDSSKLNSAANSLVATFHGSATHRESTSNPVTVTVSSLPISHR